MNLRVARRNIVGGGGLVHLDCLEIVHHRVWPAGLNGEPEDPWQHQIAIVLQNEQTGELITFASASKTGRRAVSTLLQTYRRNQKTAPGTLPVVQLTGGTYKHEKFGEIAVPIFKVVSRTSAEGAARSNNLGEGEVFETGGRGSGG